MMQCPVSQRLDDWNGVVPGSMPALVSAAIAIGRIPGEPADILLPAHRLGFLARTLGLRRPSPLSDPRLEAVRAISAALTRGITPIKGNLIAAAYRAGWTSGDLRRTFPGATIPDPA